MKTVSQNIIDVLIVGAGPVGLFCANELTRHGLTCRIIDKKTHLSEQSKALGIHIRTLDVLEDCGLIDEFLKQGHQVDGVLFKSRGKTLVNATFADIEASRHYLIDLPQDKTEAILNKSLQDKGIHVEWETELTHLIQAPNEITATIKKPNNKIELFSANWLIACDGAHSTVRHQVDAEFKGAEYKQAWWLADLLIDWQVPDNRMAIYISDKGPLACFPMGNKRYRVVMTAPQKGTENPTLEDIRNEFKQRSSDPATLSDPIWLTPFSIHHRQIQQYRCDRVFFAGDAAHIHSPMGGQGLNTGLQDIYNLAWKLALVEKRNAKPELLNSYHAERFPVGHEILKKTDKMTRIMLLRQPVLVTLRNAFIGFMASFKRVRNFMAKDLAELSICYAKSPIVHQSGCVKHVKAGDYFPAFQLTEYATQKAQNSISIVQGTQHHLFIFVGLNDKKVPQLISLARSLAKKYSQSTKIHVVLNKKTEKRDGKINFWMDEEQQVHKRFGFRKPTVVLVRPDKYIGMIQKPINEKKLMGQLYLLS
ncbi:FAD-dependent monooxygenase [Legionella shakespearei]|uniref:FAD dependent oxidoreductase n=1 Tax=Legionella shakespearei DSM 23087 TaxID=1122169 RepID=A0A0W0Z0L6_9GAMM|nr:FAD-dependent monooxygenase [Legionella shakespearei]KTD62677.1 FAD dependent oxidoreductase [Legionella shakespearei DSM 23087]